MFTVVFWTVWPLVEKRRAHINFMLHAFSKQQMSWEREGYYKVCTVLSVLVGDWKTGADLGQISTLTRTQIHLQGHII